MAAAVAALCKATANPSDESDLIVLDETGSEEDETDENTSPTQSSDECVIIVPDQSSEEEVNVVFRVPCNSQKNECKCTNCGYKKELENLRKEVITLTTKLQLLESKASCIPTNDEGEDVPLFKVHFANDALEKKYKIQVEQFVRQIMKDQPTCTIDVESANSNVIEGVVKNKNEPQVDPFPEGFIDNVGVAKSEKNCTILPTYRKEFREELRNAAEDVEVVTEKRVPPKKVCGTCKGEHPLLKCPVIKLPVVNGEPRIPRPSPNSLKHRYHLSDCNSKFSSFAPGKLSDQLRTALGLGKHEIPRHVFEIGNLGYPPGWLADARLETSGLVVYNSEGKGGEDQDDRVRIDVSKIIDYPGFNVAPENNAYDMHRSMPMVHKCNIKENFTAHLKNIVDVGTENERKRSNGSMGSPAKRAKVQGESDMDIDDDVVAIDIELEEGEVAVTPPPSTRSRSDATGRRTASPTLEDLEKKKKELMLQLVDDVGSSPSSLSSQGTPSDRRKSHSKSVEPGTPVFYPEGSIRTLPDVSKFSLGISEHAPFENLPNSTGQYEKIRHLLKTGKTAKDS